MSRPAPDLSRERPSMSSPAPVVLLVAENGDAGGIGRYCVDLAALLGDQAQLACLCPNPCGAGCWLADQCHARGVPLVQVPMPAKAWRSGLRGLVNAWKRLGRPLIHTNGRRGNAVAMVARVVVRGFQFVTTVHGVLGLHARRNAVYRVVDLGAGRLARAVIAVNEDTARRLRRAGSPRDRTHVIPNGLAAYDRMAFHAVAERRWAAGPRTGPLRIGFLGRLSREKGTRELVLVAERLTSARASVEIAIGGDGPDRGWMEEDARTMIEHGVLRFDGVIADAPRFLGEVDVLLMPSHNEGLPYVLLEAMTAGCGVVAFEVGGIPEVVSDPSLGILVAPGDVEAMVSALLRLSRDPAEVHAMGGAASRHVDEHYVLETRLPLLGSAYGLELAAPPSAATDPRGQP